MPHAYKFISPLVMSVLLFTSLKNQNQNSKINPDTQIFPPRTPQGRPFSSDEMAGEQEVCYSLPDSVLVIAVGAHQLSLVYLGLDEEVVQVLEHLLIRFELVCCRRLRWERRESELAS